MVWDAIFSRPMRQRDENPKLDYLVDVCASMLLSARGTLLQYVVMLLRLKIHSQSIIRLGRAHRKTQNLWGDEIAAIPSNAFGDRELEEAFIEGMAYLQRYPLEAVGGIEKVLQTAFDLASQREATPSASKSNGSAVGLAGRLRETVWKGFSSGLESHPEEEIDSEEESSDEYEEEKPKAQPQQGAQSTLTSRLANTVWRGITNQSAMDAPSPASSPAASPLPSPLPSPSPTSQFAPGVPPKEAAANAASTGKSMFWGYAEKLKDSDTAANLSKVTTNWRVKAIDAWTKRSNEPSPNNLTTPPPSHSAPSISSAQDHSRSISLTTVQTPSRRASDDKRGSVPIPDRSVAYSPPPRPAFFRPVRDSILVASPISRSAQASPVSDSGFSAGRDSMRGSLSNFKLPDSIPSRGSAGPRPLLLSSSSLMTGSPARSPVSPSADSRWAESVRAKRPSVTHRASQSSISSLSPSEPYRSRRGDNGSGVDSDGGASRIVPINRHKSPSPMAAASRRMSSRNSVSPPTPPKAHHDPPTDSSAPEDNARGSWGRIDAPDSPTTIPSPPLPGTPDADTTRFSDVRVKQPESQRQRGSVVLSESNDTGFVPPAPENKLSRRSATITRRATPTSEQQQSEPSTPESKNPNLRRKRFPPRLQSLRNSRSSTEPTPPASSKTLGVDFPDGYEHEATTPRAGSFDEQMIMPPSPSRRVRKTSGASAEGESTPRRTRKVSTERRTRKISTESRRKVSAERDTKHKRESAAVEGDDEGYNDLLSAYESEDQ